MMQLLKKRAELRRQRREEFRKEVRNRILRLPALTFLQRRRAAALRVAKAFENNIDDEQGWHMELLRRLSIEIPGVRPPLFNSQLASDLQELRGFRQVVRHAYDLAVRKDRTTPLIDAAERVARLLPVACNAFFSRVADGL